MPKTKNQKKNCGKQKCGKNKCASNCAKQKTTVSLANKTQSAPVAAVAGPLESGILTVKSGNEKQAQTAKTVIETAAFTADRIHKNAETFYTLFSRYEAVRELAKHLNGLPQGSPLPPAVTFKKIEFAFSVDGKDYSVDMADVKTVIEIVPIISSTLSTLLEKMYQEIFSLNNTGAAMQRAIEQAIVKPIPSNTQTNSDAEKS